ncbi:hypothetical protein CEE45_12615 [Candidatus Heimdallarchaeota archaeon B3_Heim]|nr:MAG: hypothetical protein CEE45_12615 [Candidatus Heimdallarchaeota archaeon B3_Heim]
MVYPVTLEIGTEIRLIITSLSDDNAPIGTITCNNSVISNVLLSDLPINPLFSIVKTTINASYWENLRYTVEGEFVSKYTAYWPAELMFHRQYLEFNYLTGWIEQFSHAHYKSTTLWYEYEIVRINATTTDVFEEYGGFMLGSLLVFGCGGVIVIFLKYFRIK